MTSSALTPHLTGVGGPPDGTDRGRRRVGSPDSPTRRRSRPHQPRSGRRPSPAAWPRIEEAARTARRRSGWQARPAVAGQLAAVSGGRPAHRFRALTPAAFAVNSCESRTSSLPRPPELQSAAFHYHRSAAGHRRRDPATDLQRIPTSEKEMPMAQHVDLTPRVVLGGTWPHAVTSNHARPHHTRRRRPRPRGQPMARHRPHTPIPSLRPCRERCRWPTT